MRRSTRVVSVAALSAAALSGGAVSAASVAAAAGEAAEATAEASPSAVVPGGSITVSVSCAPAGDSPPESVEASSGGFEDGVAQLHLVPGTDPAAGPAYRGSARIAPDGDFATIPEAAGEPSEWSVEGTCPAAPGGHGTDWSAAFAVSPDGGRHADRAPLHGEEPVDEGAYGDGDEDGEAEAYGEGPRGPGARDEDRHGAEDGHGRDGHGEDGPGDGSRDGHSRHSHGKDPDGRDPHDQSPDGRDPHGRDPEAAAADPELSASQSPVVRHGVHAGGGGAFTDSVPALAAGGLLIVGALCAAAQRLRHRGSSARR